MQSASMRALRRWSLGGVGAATLSSTTTVISIQILNNNAFIQFSSQPTGKPTACAGNN